MLRLDEHLQHPRLFISRIELMISLRRVLQPYAMAQHHRRVQRSVLYLRKKLFPVTMNGRLTVANQPNTTFHKRPDVEVVCETAVCRRDPAAAKVSRRRDHLIDNLGGVCLGAEAHLEIMRPSL